jgi:FkbM family methyltransferase
VKILIRKANSLLRTTLGIPQPWKRVKLAKYEFVVRDGTIRKQPDYDDAWLYALSLEARQVIDVGANIGQSAIIILLSSTVTRLLLVDPNPRALSIAMENILHNHLEERVQLKIAFVGDKSNEQVKLWSFGVASASSQYADISKTAAKRNKFMFVPTITLDDLCLMYNWAPDLIKIDVEGAETAVLQGAVNCTNQNKPRFIVEMHARSDLSMVQNVTQVLEWCKTNQYEAWFLAQHTLIIDPSIVAHRGRCHLLLQPTGLNYPERLKGIVERSPLETILQ